MNHKHLFVAVALALGLMVGCGGNGNDSPTSTAVGNTSTELRVEAVVRVERSNLKDPSKYSDADLLDPTKVQPEDLIESKVSGVQDPGNFQTGEAYYFQLVGYDATGKRTIYPASFTTDDKANTYGLVGDSGLFLASNVPTTADQFVNATYQGQRYSAPYQVRERQVRLIGKVVEQNTNTPFRNLTVVFYDDAQRQVSSVRTSYDGSFRASVPVNTASVTIVPSSIPSTHYASIVYGGKRYDAGQLGCRIPITVGAAGFSTLEPIGVTKRIDDQPTPLSDGCSE